MARGDTGILIAAENGTVVGYDETGLILTLSDGTLRQIAARLGDGPWLDPSALGDIDAWGVRQQGAWLSFDAQLPSYPHPRRFRVPVAGGDLLADAPGPLTACLSLGGSRRATALAGAPQMPCHVVGLGDDIGAVGMGGEGDVTPTDQLEHLRERTVDALAAEIVLARRRAAGRGLPLIVARTETSDLPMSKQGDGPAWRNLQAVITNLVNAAEALGVALRIPVITLDFGPEDVTTPPEIYIAATHDLMARIDAHLAALGLQAPRFLMRADETGQRTAEHWQLAVHPGHHDLCFVGPGSAVDWTATRRPTEAGLHALAAMEALATEAALDGASWMCPRLLLAEVDGATTVRVTCLADAPLMLDDGAHGFALSSGEVSAVEICDDDDKALRLHVTAPLRAGLVLSYADGQRGALRDTFAAELPDGRRAHRWALPARLRVAL